jgi:hypothetical protein
LSARSFSSERPRARHTLVSSDLPFFAYTNHSRSPSLLDLQGPPRRHHVLSRRVSRLSSLIGDGLPARGTGSRAGAGCASALEGAWRRSRAAKGPATREAAGAAGAAVGRAWRLQSTRRRRVRSEKVALGGRGNPLSSRSAQMPAVEDELALLQAELAAVQAAGGAAGGQRLSEANMVDLVGLLRSLGRLEVVVSRTGRELVTPERLRREAVAELVQRGGRAASEQIAAALDVEQAQAESAALAADPALGISLLPGGDLVSRAYLDSLRPSLAASVAARGSTSVAALAGEWTLPAELLLAALRERPLPGVVLVGDSELCSEAFLGARRAAVRGALWGCLRPAAVSAVAAAAGVEPGEVERHAGAHPGVRLRSGEVVSEAFAGEQRRAALAALSSRGCLSLATATRVWLLPAKAAAKLSADLSPGVIVLDSAIVSLRAAAALDAALADCAAHRAALELRGAAPADLPSADLLALAQRNALLGARPRAARGVSQLFLALDNRYVVSTELASLLLDRLGSRATEWAQEAVRSKGQQEQQRQQLQQAGPHEEEYTIVSTAGAFSSSAQGSLKGGAKVKGGGGQANQGLENALSLRAARRNLRSAALDFAPLKDALATLAEEGDKLLDWLVEELVRPAFEAAFRAAYVAAEQSALSGGAGGMAKVRQGALEMAFVDLFAELQLFAKGADVLAASADSNESALARELIGLHTAPVVGLLVEYACLQHGAEFEPGGAQQPEEQQQTQQQGKGQRGASGAGGGGDKAKWSAAGLARWSAPETCQAALQRLPPRSDAALRLDKALSAVAGGSLAAALAEIERSAKACGLAPRRLDAKGDKTAAHSYRLRLLSWLDASGSGAGGVAGGGAGATPQLLAYSVVLVLAQCEQLVLPTPPPDASEAAFMAYRALVERAARALPERHASALRAVAAGNADADTVAHLKRVASSRAPAEQH